MTSATLLSHIRIVLVNPTHPGNIGATARAMKTMGLQRLYLVEPKLFPHAQATERAAHAYDILEQAMVVDSLQQAVHDCCLVMGTSARIRGLEWPLLEARAAAQKAVHEAKLGQIAIVFGREHSGLTNEELALCHEQIIIPTDVEYNSLNVAAAVQIICYEIRMVLLVTSDITVEKLIDFATIAELEAFYEHLEHILVAIDFLKPSRPGRVMDRLRRLFNRSRLERTELNILRGILTAIEKRK